MKCKRCNQEYDMPNTNICGNCADDLRQWEIAEQAYQELELENPHKKETPAGLPF